jgi:hypothetical protein
MSTIFRIRYALGDQPLLRRVGPIIPASWGIAPISGSTSTTIRTPEQIRGNVLVDTGATHIAIDDSAAQELGLQPLPERQNMYGVGGKHSAAMYNALLFLPVEAVRPIPGKQAGSSFALGVPIQVNGVVGLRDGFESQGIKAPNGLPVIGILGRTFLQFTTFTYDGLSGNLVIDIDESVQYPKKG